MPRKSSPYNNADAVLLPGAAACADSVIEYLEGGMPSTMAKRTIAITLLTANVSIAQVMELTGFCETTVKRIQKAILSGNIQNLLEIGGGGRPAKLADVEEKIVAELESDDFFTRKQVAAMIKEKFGVELSLSAVGNFLKKNGYVSRQCGSLPAKADAAAQRKFYEEVLLPKMQSAARGECRLFFLDASHFVFGHDYLGRVYCKKRRFVRTFSGRKRYNVLAAINHDSKRMATVSNTEYITSTEVCELLRKLSDEYPGQEINVVLDNARYQKCHLVQDTASELDIKLLYIPPYSPNLNLIERVWRFGKKELAMKYYDNFNEFMDKIDSIIDSSSKENLAAMNKLLGEKVQLFDDLVLIAGNTYESAKHKESTAA